MELNARKQAILKAVIDHYIETGEPVGSKVLCEILGTNLSPATLRNEMSELDELGYLYQPHTSAGRIPTNEALRLYIKTMLKRSEPPVKTRKVIDDMLYEASKDPVHISSLAAQFLSDFTGLPTVLATVGCETSYIRRVEIIPMGRRAVLILLITSDGIAKSRFCRTSEDISVNMIARFDKIMASDIIGSELSSLTAATLQNVTSKAGEHILTLLPLFTAVFDMADEIANSNLEFGGNHFGLSQKQRQLLPFITDISGDIDVVFGDTTGIDELKPSNVVVARYNMGENSIGRIGVIGPARMAYRQMLPSIQYFAEKLGTILEQSMIDMEE